MVSNLISRASYMKCVVYIRRIKVEYHVIVIVLTKKSLGSSLSFMTFICPHSYQMYTMIILK